MSSASVVSAYLHSVLDPNKFSSTLANLVKAGRVVDEHLPFEAVAFMGMSGALVGCALASSLNKGVLLVRKGTDDCHSKRKVEGSTFVNSYIIVDDFVATGKTIAQIINTLSNEMPGSVCRGVIVYNEGRRGVNKEYYGVAGEFNVFSAQEDTKPIEDWFKKEEGRPPPVDADMRLENPVVVKTDTLVYKEIDEELIYPKIPAPKRGRVLSDADVKEAYDAISMPNNNVRFIKLKLNLDYPKKQRPLPID